MRSERRLEIGGKIPNPLSLRSFPLPTETDLPVMSRGFVETHFFFFVVFHSYHITEEFNANAD